MMNIHIHNDSRFWAIFFLIVGVIAIFITFRILFDLIRKKRSLGKQFSVEDTMLTFVLLIFGFTLVSGIVPQLFHDAKAEDVIARNAPFFADTSNAISNNVREAILGNSSTKVRANVGTITLSNPTHILITGNTSTGEGLGSGSTEILLNARTSGVKVSGNISKDNAHWCLTTRHESMWAVYNENGIVSDSFNGLDDGNNISFIQPICVGGRPYDHLGNLASLHH